jgi:3-phosphoshikimate 1-carboxyvinyltransferase
MQYLAGMALPSPTEAYPNDVKIFLDMLSSRQIVLNAGDAGTAMRFACAVFSTVEGKRTLCGTDRMHERPIGILVDALRQLGAEITYLEKEGFPPMSIKGRQLEGGHIVVPSDISSQYISALLMIAPCCNKTVVIELSGVVVSMPYIDMTIALMRQMGIEVLQEARKFRIEPQVYARRDLPVESDWSAASFIYEMAALSEACVLELPGLSLNSVQGDRQAEILFEKLGIDTVEIGEGILLKKKPGFKLPAHLTIDFTDIPDLLQSFALSCVALGIELNASGLYNLHLKETDRLKALKINIESMGGKVVLAGREAQFAAPTGLKSSQTLKAFNDHRMVMSLAPLALRMQGMVIDDKVAVLKSFPAFWTEVAKVGLELHENS